MKPAVGSAAALAAASAAMIPRVRIRSVPGGRAVHTPEAAAKYNQRVVRKAEGLTRKITQAHAQLDHLKAKRNTATRSFDEAAEKHGGEIYNLKQEAFDMVGRRFLLESEIERTQKKLQLLQAESGKVMDENKQNIKDQTTAQLLRQAAQDKAKAAGVQDQPKIDQQIKVRDRLIERLYHHQLLHPGCLPEKASTEDAKSTDGRQDNEAIRSATPAGSDKG